MKTYKKFLKVHLSIIYLILLSFSCKDTSAPLNTAPVISSLNASPQIVKVNETTLLECVATDSDGDSLTITWSSSAGEFLNGNQENPVMFKAPSVAQFIQVTVTVSDGSNSVQDLLTFDVAEQQYCQTGSGGTDVHLRQKFYSENIIFQGGTNGYHSFRIPSIIKSPSGNLIAFSEGRKNSKHDYGNIDVVYRLSYDNGATWGPLRILFDKGEGTCGNPTAVVDSETDAVWVFMSYNDEFHNQRGDDGYQTIDEWGDRRVYSIVSYNDGQSWEDLRDRTSELVPPDYCWDAVGPGNGIQIKHGPYAGRLIIPAISRNIYSDDNGVTWSYMPIATGTSEGTIVELCNGDLMRNDRGACIITCGPSSSCEWKDPPLRRWVSISKDHGITWTPFERDLELYDPICQASIIRYNEGYPPRLIFINPSSTVARYKMRVRISYDDGRTWPVQRLLDEDRGGYSSLAKTEDFMIGSLQEMGDNGLGQLSIIFRKFNLPWIVNGIPEPVD